ncbi:MAG: glycosyltransferase family 2 protein [Candidatus Hodarchaeales archaeon]|jgi:glycosyltransferase involved in cell wall biosynthesis
MLSVKDKDITIQVVSLNRPTFLYKTLLSLGDFPGENVIVYDNNTPPGNNLNLIKTFAKKFDKYQWIFSDKNSGCGGAWNYGLKYAKTDWVVQAPDDVIFRPDWLDIFNKILKVRKDIIFVAGAEYDLPIFHREMLYKVGLWDERCCKGVSAEDDDHYLRTVEALGFTPRVEIGDHIGGAERIEREKLVPSKEVFDREDNWTYFCDSRHSDFPPLAVEIPHSRGDFWNNFLTDGDKPGIGFFNKKWSRCHKSDPKALLNKDGTFWKRELPEKDNA